MYKISSETIEFFWDSERIFDLVSYKSAIQAAKDEEMLHIITDDKREFVVEALRPIFVKLYGCFIDLFVSLPNVLYVHLPNADLGIFISGFTVKCFRDKAGELTVNEQRLNIISSLCQEYVVCEVIRVWCEEHNREELKKIYETESIEIMDRLKENLKYLKKRAYQRSFS